ERTGIQVCGELLALFNLIRIFFAEEFVVDTRFRVDGVGSRDPVNGRLDLASIGSVAAARGWVVSTVPLNHFSLVVLDHALRRNEEAVAQAHLAPRRQAVVLLRRILAKIVLLDVEHLRK